MSDYGEDTRVFGDPEEIPIEEIVDNAADYMSHGAEYTLKEAQQEYGEWLVEKLDEDPRLIYHEGYKSWARTQESLDES